MANETPSRPPPFMANAILNFHFDFLHPSLNWFQWMVKMDPHFHFASSYCQWTLIFILSPPIVTEGPKWTLNSFCLLLLSRRVQNGPLTHFVSFCQGGSKMDPKLILSSLIAMELILMAFWGSEGPKRTKNSFCLLQLPYSRYCHHFEVSCFPQVYISDEKRPGVTPVAPYF